MTKVGQTYDNLYNGYVMQERNPANSHIIPASELKIPSYYDVPAKPVPKNFKEALEDNPVYSMAIKPMFGALIEHPFVSLADRKSVV